MKRIVRPRPLNPEEAARLREAREAIAKELGEIVAGHSEREASRDQVQTLLHELKAAREAAGLSLSDLQDRTGMDRSALSKLETGRRPNPTLETLIRYAVAVGKRVEIGLVDESRPIGKKPSELRGR